MNARSGRLNEFINYSGLYRDKRTHNENYIFCETIADRSKDFDWKIYPHFHSSLYQLFFAEKGYATLSTSEGETDLVAPFMVFIPPLNIHGFHFSEHIEGRILTFSDFYTQTLQEKYPSILGSLEKILWIQDDEYIPVLQELKETFNKIHCEFDSENGDKAIVLEYQLYLLVLQFYRFSNNHLTTCGETNNNLYYLRKFQYLIKISKSPFTSLHVYADHLHITTKHLNRICRSLKQMSALQVVQMELVLKAKAHLYHFNSNISEIAYDLGFDDPSYFTRLFKKHTGLTPNEYRKKHPLAKINKEH